MYPPSDWVYSQEKKQHLFEEIGDKFQDRNISGYWHTVVFMREVQERDVNDYMYETAEETEISLFRLIYHLFQKEHIITRNSGRTTMSATLLNVK